MIEQVWLVMRTDTITGDVKICSVHETIVSASEAKNRELYEQTWIVGPYKICD